METVLCLFFLACCADGRNSSSLDQSERFYSALWVRGSGFSCWNAGVGGVWVFWIHCWACFC